MKSRRIVESMSLEEAFSALNSNKNTKKIRESKNDVFVVEVPSNKFGLDLGFFADEVFENEEEDLGLVHKYYLANGATDEDLMVKKIFTSSEFSEEDYDALENFGFQLANGDYLYTRANHDIAPATVKCKNYESMCNYIINGYEPNELNVDDRIEESVLRRKTAKNIKESKNAKDEYFSKVQIRTLCASSKEVFDEYCRALTDVIADPAEWLENGFSSAEEAAYLDCLTIDKFVKKNIPEVVSWKLVPSDMIAVVTTKAGDQITVRFESDDSGFGIECFLED